MYSIQQALNSNLPYFGRNAVGIGAPLFRYSVLRSLVKWVENRRPGKAIKILEVGSWIGASALIFARSIEEFNEGNGLITCVDSWTPYIDTDVNNGYEHIVMTAALEKDAAYELFLHNCRSCRIDHVIKIKRGNSKTVLPELIGNQYDIIYLDGDHSFEMAFSDIDISKGLIAEGGILCGDDLEKQYDDVDPKIVEEGIRKNKDYILLDDKVSGFHPGVTMAVHQAIGKSSMIGCVWFMQCVGDELIQISDIEVERIVPEELLIFSPKDFGTFNLQFRPW